MAVPIRPPTSLGQWEHHSFRNLDPIKDGDFISAESVLLCAGPPLLSQTGGLPYDVEIQIQTGDVNVNLGDTTAYPIGLVQGVTVGQNKQQIRFFELGSNVDYLVGGRTVGNITINRVMLLGASLMRVLYAYYKNSDVVEVNALYDSQAASAGLNSVWISPGSEAMYMNLASDLFNNPIGLMMVLLSQQNLPIGAFYFERCVIHGHNFAVDAQGIILQENVSLSFSRAFPVHIEGVNLLSALKTVDDVFGIPGVI